MVGVLLIVSGRVQMVRFRVYTRKTARTYGIVGNVKNNPDGTVSIQAYASTKEILQKFIQSISQGSLLSRVDKVQEFWDNIPYDKSIQDFVIIR